MDKRPPQTASLLQLPHHRCPGSIGPGGSGLSLHFPQPDPGGVALKGPFGPSLGTNLKELASMPSLLGEQERQSSPGRGDNGDPECQKERGLESDSLAPASSVYSPALRCPPFQEAFRPPPPPPSQTPHLPAWAQALLTLPGHGLFTSRKGPATPPAPTTVSRGPGEYRRCQISVEPQNRSSVLRVPLKLIAFLG